MEKSTPTKAQETLEFKSKNPKQDFNFDAPLITPEKGLMGVTNIQVWKTAYNKTERVNNFPNIILGYFEQITVNFEKSGKK